MAQIVFIYLCLSICLAEGAVKTHSLEPWSTDYGTKISEEAINANNFSHFEKKCQDKFVSYANETGICGVQNIQEFFENSKNHHTCADRCGHKATYGKHNECSCDAACVFFDDCCGDFIKTCTELYYKGKEFSSHLQGASAACTGENFRTIINTYVFYDAATTPSVIFTSETSTSQTPTEVSIVDNDLKDARPLTKIYTLRDVSSDLADFKVLDTTIGVIFDNHLLFNRWRMPGSKKPKFLPLIRVFECPEVITEYNTVQELTNRCRRIKLHHAKTTLYRNCPSYTVVSCYCNVKEGGTEQFFDLLHDTCAGKRNNLPLFTRHKTLFESMKAKALDGSLDESLSGGDCFSGSVGKHKPEYVTQDHDAEYIFKMITTPIILQAERHAGDPEQSNGISGSIKERLGEHADGETGDINELEFVVEMTKAVERRIRCRKLTTVLNICKIEECASGALLWSDPSLHATEVFKNGACFLPTHAAVRTGPTGIFKVPACTCLRITMAVSDLGLWDVKLERSVLCVFMLIARREATVDFGERMIDMTPTDYNYTATIREAEAVLQERLNASQNNCPDDKVHWLQLCFFEHEDKNMLNCKVSMKLFAGFSEQEKDEARSQKMSYLSATSLVLGIFGIAVHVFLFG